MALDNKPKKPCKHCGLTGHYPYQCFVNPRKSLKRTKIKKVGKQTKQWFITRATWIRKNPPPIEGLYWECYLRIHPFCPVRIDAAHLTLDHVISRTRDPSKRFNADNLKPACLYCNNMKGSRSLDQVKPLANGSEAEKD